MRGSISRANINHIAPNLIPFIQFFYSIALLTPNSLGLGRWATFLLAFCLILASDCPGANSAKSSQAELRLRGVVEVQVHLLAHPEFRAFRTESSEVYDEAPSQIS